MIAAALLGSVLLGEAGLVFRCEAAAPRREVPCRVCLVPDSPAQPLSCGPSGEPIVAPAGRYGLRVFADGLAARDETIVVPAVAGRSRPVTVALSPGGTIAATSARPPAMEVWSLTTGRRDRVLPRDAEIPIPAGAAVALAFAEDGSLTAVSRPVVIVPGDAPAALAFEAPPAGAGDVAVLLEYPDGAGPQTRDATVRLAGPQGTRAAGAVAVPGSSRHFAVFYAVAPGRWNLQVESQHWSGEPRSLEVRAGEAVYVPGVRLLPRPTLTVDLAIDPALEAEPRRISLHRCAPGEWAASGRLDPERCPPAGTSREPRAVFARLEARWHVLEIEIGGRRLRRGIDLRPGADVEERVGVEATRLSGRVSRGRRAAPADIELESLDSPGAPVVARAGPDGDYRASLWPQGSWRAQVLPDRIDRGDAAVFAVDAPKPGPSVRNFDLPPTELSLQLLDAKTKDSIRDGNVAYLAFGQPRWRDADESGQVRVSGVAPGVLELHADAPGYRPRQVAVEVEDSASLQSFEIELSALERANAFQAQLPSGAPAASAKVFVGTSPTGLERERADCDSQGVCRLGERPGAGEAMLIAHPEAGFTVVRAEDALAAGRAALAPGGGILRVLPARGQATADALLQVSVSIAGATLPPVWLDNLALAIARPSRTAVFPGARSGFFLPGLPAGAVALTITAALREEAGGFGPPSVVAGPVVVELPTTEAVTLELP